MSMPAVAALTVSRSSTSTPEKCRSFANIGGDCRHILVRAGEGLVHDLGAALLKNDERQPVAVGDRDGLDESEMLDPERKHGFDFFDEKHGTEFFDGHF